METVITRDTDIIREYLAVLDARERELSPFARFMATVKLARLRWQLDTLHLEGSEEDVAALRHEIDARLDKTYLRRWVATPWGGRAAAFLLMVVGQQLILGLIWLAMRLFMEMAPVPAWWNRELPREEPVFLYLFMFFFFFAPPMLALLVLYGGRYFRAWRMTLPATLLIVLASVLMVFLVMRDKQPAPAYPAARSSLAQFARERGLNLQSYNQWADANWLMKDPKFQRDYEKFLRNGPGRWITSRFDANDAAAWRGALPVMGEYLDGGQDPEAFREWLRYYFDRNRIYSEDRIDSEVDALTGGANQPFLGIWQVEPYLKERDRRMHQAYLGSINRSMKLWAMVSLGLFALVFLLFYLTGPALSFWERAASRRRQRARRAESETYAALPNPGGTPPGRAERLRDRYYSFPERREISTPPFFDTPFRVLSNVHRAFVRLVVFTATFVFAFWAVVYALDLAAGNENVASQADLMRGYLLLGGSTEVEARDATLLAQADAAAPPAEANYATASGQGATAIPAALTEERALAARILELEARLEELEYGGDRRFKKQEKIIAAQKSELDLLKGLASQLQMTTEQLPAQIAEAGSRASAVEARVGGVLNDVNAAREQAANIERQLTTKLGEVETRAARAADQVGRVEDQASVLAARTEALEKELDRRARQVEARTEELGERTASLNEREERLARLQRIAFVAILDDLEADINSLDRRSGSTLFRLFNKGEGRREVETLRARIAAISGELAEIKSDHAQAWIDRLNGLARRVDEIAKRFD